MKVEINRGKSVRTSDAAIVPPEQAPELPRSRITMKHMTAGFTLHELSHTGGKGEDYPKRERFKLHRVLGVCHLSRMQPFPPQTIRHSGGGEIAVTLVCAYTPGTLNGKGTHEKRGRSTIECRKLRGVDITQHTSLPRGFSASSFWKAFRCK